MTPLFEIALKVRENASAANTKVGCVIQDENGNLWTGCNVAHWFHTQTLHSEVNAIGSMIAGGGKQAVKVVIVSDREYFTPCGACRDMLMQYGGKYCVIESYKLNGEIVFHGELADLMPHYPH